MMTLYGLEFQRIDGRYHKPVVEIIPADTPPAVELETLIHVMKTEVGAHVVEMSPGRYAMHLRDANQVWAVRVVSVGDPGATAEMAAVNVIEIGEAS